MRKFLQPLVNNISSRAKTFSRLYISKPEKFLNDVSGLVHVGANVGQERGIYKHYGVNVVWVEPIPHIFEALKNNIKEYEHQQAFQALVADVDNKEFEFHISSNDGLSSSIYELKDHKDIWPDVNHKESILLNSTTLPSLFKDNSLDISKYQALIMDTQGSELLVLKGSLPILQYFKYIKTEVADFEAYEGCCTLNQMIDFMLDNGYKEHSRRIFAQDEKVGTYYDIIFKRNDNQ